LLMFSFTLSLFLCCCPRRWGETMSLNCGHKRTYCSPLRRYEYGSHGGMILTVESRRIRRRPCPSATFSTTNRTWSDSGANSVLRVLCSFTSLSPSLYFSVSFIYNPELTYNPTATSLYVSGFQHVGSWPPGSRGVIKEVS
jgi:hypothetical protein